MDRKSMVGSVKKVIYSYNIEGSMATRESLEKLSEDELINMVEFLQQLTKKGGKLPKFTIPNNVKKFISYYKPSKSNNIVTYDKKPISLAEFRHEELELANITANTLGSSFLSLFQSRLNNMPNDRENVQITHSVDIGNTIETKVKRVRMERKK